MSRLEIERIEALVTAPQLTDSDKAYIEGFASSSKRRGEITAWRTLLRRTLVEMGHEVEASNEILYNEVGAPYLVDSKLHISVSHSSTLVAVVVSSYPCAVDIESCERDFERVAKRYATPRERESFDLAVVWSAKEALYKLSGATGLDLLDDIKIHSITDNQIDGSIREVHHPLTYTLIDGHVVVYA
ncbi:MAG: 4'-phosphopantetheinyl transferase superfamily protein [Rikenellaceae bacterium]